MAKLPYFAPLSHDELRALYAKHPNPDIRRLVLEVVRYRDVIKTIDEHYRGIHQSWRETVGGNTFGLQLLQKVMLEERERLMF